MSTPPFLTPDLGDFTPNRYFRKLSFSSGTSGMSGFTVKIEVNLDATNAGQHLVSNSPVTGSVEGAANVVLQNAASWGFVNTANVAEWDADYKPATS